MGSEEAGRIGINTGDTPFRIISNLSTIKILDIKTLDDVKLTQIEFNSPHPPSGGFERKVSGDGYGKCSTRVIRGWRGVQPPSTGVRGVGGGG